MIISFDYDDTLTKKKYQDLAVKYINEGNKVLILTARQDNHMDDVYSLARKLNIDRRNVHNTNGQDKYKYVNRLHIDIHYDNNKTQIDKINNNTNTKGILIN